jgi:alginate O-acetyltransferase complex protein AlgI
LRPGPSARAAAWLLVLVATAAAEHITRAEPPGIRMLGIISVLFYAMKAVVAVDGGTRLGAWRFLAFAAAWPGMRPALFESVGSPARPGAGRVAGHGFVCLAAGAGLVLLARLIARSSGSRELATLALLPGLSLILHFGILGILAGGWRALGADVDALFRAPLRSRSLAEFWGRRWNLAFSEMTAIGVYRPVSGWAGRPLGLAVAFAASGVLHELAISLPVRAGFGLPLAYFALHGGLLTVERWLEARGRPIYRRAWLGRVWTLGWLAAPLPLLFHEPFLRGVIWPLLE